MKQGFGFWTHIVIDLSKNYVLHLQYQMPMQICFFQNKGAIYSQKLTSASTSIETKQKRNAVSPVKLVSPITRYVAYVSFNIWGV